MFKLVVLIVIGMSRPGGPLVLEAVAEPQSDSDPDAPPDVEQQAFKGSEADSLPLPEDGDNQALEASRKQERPQNLEQNIKQWLQWQDSWNRAV